MLRTDFHLKSELLSRPGFDELPEEDLNHLAGVAGRAYITLVVSWVEHMGYLHAHYPYLFSLAVRTNPFAPAASPVVRLGNGGYILWAGICPLDFNYRIPIPLCLGR